MADLMTDEDKQAAIRSYLEAQNSPAPQISVADNSLPSQIPDPDMEEAPASAPVAPTPPAPVSPLEDKTSAIRKQLAKQFAQANDDSGVRAAQEHASDVSNVANVGHALETLARSNSMAHGGAGVDSGFWQGLKQSGQQGVQQAQTARQTALNAFLQQHEITRQVAQDVMAQGDYEQKQKAAKVINDQNDPNSAPSKNAQQAFSHIFSEYPGINAIDVSNFSAADLASASKNADVVAKLNEIKESKKLQATITASNLKDKKDTKQDALYTEMNTKGLGGRGAPQYVQKAASGIQSGKRALDLINQYPDLNKMPPQQVHLLNTEIDSMAKAGVSTEGGIHGLEANTMQSNWAKFISSIEGEPSGAQLAQFIGENKKYLENMMKTNADAVRDYKLQNYNGYKKRLTSEQDMQYRNDNPEVFKEEEIGSKGTPPPGQGSPMKSKGGGNITAAYNHPQADQAKAWAKANPNDPRSAEILKRLGTMNAGL